MKIFVCHRSVIVLRSTKLNGPVCTVTGADYIVTQTLVFSNYTEGLFDTLVD